MATTAVSIHEFIVNYGYATVFVLVMVESLGVPLPGETTVIAASTYAGATHKLSVWLIFVCAAAGAVVGDTIGYWIGDKGGYRLVYRYGRYVRLDEPKIKLARYLFDRHGGPVVFFGRFVSVLRTYAAFLAGTSKMRYRRFLVFNASGGIVWAALYSFAAYYAGSALSKASSTVTIVFVVAAVVGIVVAILLIRRKIGPLEAAAEAAYPGPLTPPGEQRDDEDEEDGDAAGGGSGTEVHADPALSRSTRTAGPAAQEPDARPR